MSLMEVLVVLLAVAGIAVPVTFCWVLISLSHEDAPEPDPDPYQEGLDASARISAMAFEAERTMHQLAQEHSPAAGDPPSEGH
ncbi:MAG: hypothetical protein ACM3JL_00370 [Nitrososphaerota archaeon]